MESKAILNIFNKEVTGLHQANIPCSVPLRSFPTCSRFSATDYSRMSLEQAPLRMCIMQHFVSLTSFTSQLLRSYPLRFSYRSWWKNRSEFRIWRGARRCVLGATCSVSFFSTHSFCKRGRFFRGTVPCGFYCSGILPGREKIFVDLTKDPLGITGTARYFESLGVRQRRYTGNFCMCRSAGSV